MLRIKRIFSPILATGLVVVLSACGFQLRGAADIAPDLQKLSVQGNQQAFQRTLIRSLERTGITVSEAAPYTIDVLSVTEDERLSSTTGGNIVVDYNVTTTAIWQMTDASGTVLIPSREMSQYGSYQRNVNEFNASQNARKDLVSDLQQSLVQVMTRSIASIKESELQAKIAKAAKAAAKQGSQPQLSQ